MIKKERKYRYILFACLCLSFFALLNFKIFALSEPKKIEYMQIQKRDYGPLVKIGNLDIPVELATSTQAVTKGLSGRTSLAKNKGMLFVFAKPYRYRFWMPDMHFPIDIIWINEGKVVGVTQNASNVFDPNNPVFYKPPVPAQYVLEVNAGFSSKNSIRPGAQVTFKNIK